MIRTRHGDNHMTDATYTGLTKIGQIFVRVSDLEKATEFYRDVLGMTHLFQVPNMSFFDCGGVRLMLGVPEKPEYDHPASIIYYAVGEIHETFAELTARGVAFRGEPHCIARLPDHELWMAFFNDIDGNVLALMSEVRE